MHIEENRKVLIDTQSSKDKIEKLKVELYDLRKRIKKMDKYQSLYEELKAKENERQQLEIEQKAKIEIKKQKEMKSFLGHLKSIKQ